MRLRRLYQICTSIESKRCLLNTTRIVCFSNDPKTQTIPRPSDPSFPSLLKINTPSSNCFLPLFCDPTGCSTQSHGGHQRRQWLPCHTCRCPLFCFPSLPFGGLRCLHFRSTLRFVLCLERSHLYQFFNGVHQRFKCVQPKELWFHVHVLRSIFFCRVLWLFVFWFKRPQQKNSGWERARVWVPLVGNLDGCVELDFRVVQCVGHVQLS